MPTRENIRLIARAPCHYILEKTESILFGPVEKLRRKNIFKLPVMIV